MTLGMLINGRKREDLLVKALKEVSQKREREAKEAAQRREQEALDARSGALTKPNASQSSPADPIPETPGARTIKHSGKKPRSVVPVVASGVCIDDRVFGPMSETDLHLPDAVQFAKQTIDGLDYVLWSLREAAQLRVRGKQPGPENYCLTRTAVIYFIKDGMYFAAFDDSRIESENIILSRIREGYDALNKDGGWRVEKNDPIIAGALSRAKAADRDIQVQASRNEFKFPTGKGAYYGKARVNRVIFGPDVSGEYSWWLNDIKQKLYGYTYILSQSDLMDLGLDQDHVEIRPLRLGGEGDTVGIYEGSFDGVGRVCGVAKKPLLMVGGTPP